MTAKPVSTTSTCNESSLAHRLHQKAFNALYNRSLLYNTCWEDPAVDRQALELSERDTVLVITSAGCNALDYVLDEPERVVAVDANPLQNALLDLKIAGIRTLEFDDFFRLFGLGVHHGYGELYRHRLRPALPAASRRIWDRRTRWFSGRGWRPGLYYHGLSGLVARLVRAFIDRSPSLRHGMDALLEAACLEEQRRIYDEISPLLFNKTLNWALQRQFTMSLLGVPYPQRQEVQASHEGGVAGFVRSCLDYVCRQLPIATNYFWGVYLRGSYTPTCCPEYLKAANFDRLKNLVDRVESHTTTVTDYLQGADHQVTRFILLDHMDWMGWYYPDALAEEWQAIFDRAGDDSRVLFRSGSRQPTFLEPVKVTANGDTGPLTERLHFHRDWAERLHHEDRVHTYASFHIADIKR